MSDFGVDCRPNGLLGLPCDGAGAWAVVGNYQEVNVIEEPKGSRVLWQPLKVEARVFEVSNDQWGVRSGAVVWYATEKSGSMETYLCRPVHRGN